LFRLLQVSAFLDDVVGSVDRVDPTAAARRYIARRQAEKVGFSEDADDPFAVANDR
jgi:hypothetical protein